MQLLSITQAAERLSCSRGHVYNLIAAGYLRAVDIGIAGRSKTRVHLADLVAFVETRSRRVGPRS